MGHLTTESLARLVSEAPYPEEKDHLDSCPACQAELQALRKQTEAMGALPDLRPPAGDWQALEARLTSEGLIRSSGLSFQAARWRSSGWLQAAAALILFIGGTALGTGFTQSARIGEFARGAPPPGIAACAGGEWRPTSHQSDGCRRGSPPGGAAIHRCPGPVPSTHGCTG